ncbi:ArnT family glycosyltransferase [Paludibaculum fermentans]|uniref:ArnT family glycosyltransferase n=1 Tax=Paludibaculum fermentans TaxID=1473598 RepID=UPI003EBEB15B
MRWGTGGFPANRLAAVAAFAAFVLHLAGNPHYGFFRDELYLIVCGQHPQWGYVDQPALSPLLAAASQIFGPSLVLLRAVPACFAAGGVYVAVRLAEEFGGAAFAQALAALSVFFAPVLMSFGMKVSPDMVGLWLWPLAVLYLVRVVQGGDPRGWLAVGVAAGVALHGKYTAVFFLISLLAGLVLTRTRRVLFTRWFVLGCLACGVIALPSFLWQAHYGFPQLEMLRNAERGKNAIVGPLTFLLQQVVLTGMALALIWMAGLAWLFSRPGLRFLAYGFVVLMALMIGLHAKHYYPGDVYPYLFAAGAVALEGWTRGRRFVRAALTVGVVVTGLLLTPVVMPVLPEPQMVSYTRWLLARLGLEPKTLATEIRPEGELSSDWAGMHGWPELASTVARVYQSLPEADRQRAVIAAENYGEASAIDFLGRPYGLPPVISGHNQYFLWGTHGYRGDVTICVGGDCGARLHLFARCERAATFTAPWVQPDENNLPITVCRDIRIPLGEIWPRVKHYQ